MLNNIAVIEVSKYTKDKSVLNSIAAERVSVMHHKFYGAVKLKVRLKLARQAGLSLDHTLRLCSPAAGDRFSVM